MKFRIFFISFFLLSNFLFAQTDKKAEDILKGVSAKYKSYQSLKANFTITIENPNDKTKETQKGVLFLKGQKYKLQIVGQEVISDGKTRWTYLKDANEVQIDNQKDDSKAITPSNIFTIYEKGWLAKFVNEQKTKTVVSQNLELIPSETKSKNIFKVKLAISKKDKTILSAKIFDKSGAIQTIAIDKLLPNAAGSDSLYLFNKENYPGSDIVDLR